MSGPPLYVYGASGHGRVVADVARLAGYVLAAFLDDAPALAGGTVDEAAVMPGTTLQELPPGTLVGLGVGSNRHRARLLAEAARLALALPTLIHPSATLASSVVIGRGTLVTAKAVLNPGATVGAGVIINTGAIVEHDCRVGDGAHISPGAVLTGCVTIGPLAHVGAGAVVLPGRRVGARAVVGAGAVVTTDVDDDCVVIGVPARPRVEDFRR